MLKEKNKHVLCSFEDLPSLSIHLFKIYQSVVVNLINSTQILHSKFFSIKHTDLQSGVTWFKSWPGQGLP
jgi:hypothetical protein